MIADSVTRFAKVFYLVAAMLAGIAALVLVQRNTGCPFRKSYPQVFMM